MTALGWNGSRWDLSSTENGCFFLEGRNLPNFLGFGVDTAPWISPLLSPSPSALVCPPHSPHHPNHPGNRPAPGCAGEEGEERGLQQRTPPKKGEFRVI